MQFQVFFDENLVDSGSFASGTDGGINNYTFTANASSSGIHKIRAEVSNPSASQDLDKFNFNTEHEWLLTVT